MRSESSASDRKHKREDFAKTVRVKGETLDELFTVVIVTAEKDLCPHFLLSNLLFQLCDVRNEVSHKSSSNERIVLNAESRILLLNKNNRHSYRFAGLKKTPTNYVAYFYTGKGKACLGPRPCQTG